MVPSVYATDQVEIPRVFGLTPLSARAFVACKLHFSQKLTSAVGKDYLPVQHGSVPECRKIYLTVLPI